jgi:hypothetical protein
VFHTEAPSPYIAEHIARANVPDELSCFVHEYLTNNVCSVRITLAFLQTGLNFWPSGIASERDKPKKQYIALQSDLKD